MNLLLNAAYCYKLCDAGVANLLGLETCRHATSMINYPKIWLLGNKTSCGGNSETVFLKATSNDPAWIKQREQANAKMAYVWRDTVANHDGGLISSIENSLFSIGKRGFFPMFFSAQANAVSVMPYLGTVAAAIAGPAMACITPTIKYHFTPEELESQFEADPDLRAFALRTRENISPFHLGITGSLLHGINTGLVQRIKDNPAKFALGCAQVAAAIGLNAASGGVASSYPLVNMSIQVAAKFAANHQGICRLVQSALAFSTW